MGGLCGQIAIRNVGMFGVVLALFSSAGQTTNEHQTNQTCSSQKENHTHEKENHSQKKNAEEEEKNIE